MSTCSSDTGSSAPDTLDLAEYGAKAINGALGSCDPDRGFENYFLTLFDVHPAYVIHFGSQVRGVLPKYVEAMPLLRLMSGSQQHRDLEQGMLARATAQYTMANLISRSCGFGQGGVDEYDCEFKADTVISTGTPRTGPGGQSQTWYRIPRGEHMREAEAPTKEPGRYVHGTQVITW